MVSTLRYSCGDLEVWVPQVTVVILQVSNQNKTLPESGTDLEYLMRDPRQS